MRKLLPLTAYLVSDPEIRDFYQKALDNAPKEFWTAPASSSGKYHSAENNAEGGLANAHTLKAVCVVKSLADHEYKILPQDDEAAIAGKKLLKDVVVVAAGCHDMKKGGEPWDRFYWEHGRLASEWLDQFELREEAKIRIKEAVYWHMNCLHRPESELPKALDENRPSYVRLVQYADAMAARRWLSFLPGLPLSQEAVDDYAEKTLKETLEYLVNELERKK
jgi:hypothetical protein